MEDSTDYILEHLEFNLEERRDFISDHNEEMAYICKRLSQYIEDVKHTLELNSSHSIVAHHTYNLVLDLAKASTSLTIYDYLYASYLLGEDYDKNYNNWLDFSNKAKPIKQLIQNLIKENYFNETDETFHLDDIVPPTNPFVNAKRSLAILECKVSILNGEGLLSALFYYLNAMEDWLNRFKMGSYEVKDDDFEKIYAANYELYKKQYWVIDGASFRQHIRDNYFRPNKSQIEVLEEQLNYEKRDFSSNKTGSLWRDFFIDKKQLYFEMRRAELDDEQWKYFFKNICRFEEYKRWIEELKTPPESNENRQKRERLLNSNSIFNLDAARPKKVDILLLYKFIDTHFMPIRFVYEWFALFYLLRRKNLLQNCTTEDFERQMNESEWFAHVEKKCSANEINTYSFLNTIAPDAWGTVQRPTGNRATNKSIQNVFRKYAGLENTIDEIYVKE